MALVRPGTRIVSTGNAYSYTANNTDVIIRSSALIMANGVGSIGLSLTGSNHDVTIAGTIYGLGHAVQLGDDATDTGNRMFVLRGAALMTDMTTGHSAAVRVSGANSALVNSGSISGATGVSLFAYNSGTAALSNYGGIFGNDAGILLSTAAEGSTFRIFNDGQIAGTTLAINGSGSASRILLVNSGVIRGDVNLSTANDFYDGRTGRISGIVYGDDGNDTFRPGAGAEQFNGDAGIDTLDFRLSTGVRVTLNNNAANTGVALGDQYLDFDVVRGSLRGNDTITGSAIQNALYGHGGRDVLFGGADEDSLEGGLGRDRLQGDDGNDTFIYRSLADGGDFINDFTNLVTEDDRFHFFGTFAAILPNGALDASRFVTSTTNRARDFNDRFIFRTGDETLWFDPDGKGRKAPVLIANLQDGAVITATDIFIGST